LPVHDDSIVDELVVTKYSVQPYATQDIFLERLQAILDDKEGYERKHKAVLEHMPLFDYTTLYPFDTYICISSKLRYIPKLATEEVVGVL
jgi:hypothetical protein